MSVKRILIVEDDSDFSESLSGALRLKQHVVVVANNGLEAIEKSKDQIFDVCFIDIKMPWMNGFDCLEQLKKIQPKSTMHVIMTGFRDHENLSRAEGAGACEVLLKPFSMFEFLRLAEMSD